MQDRGERGGREGGGECRIEERGEEGRGGGRRMQDRGGRGGSPEYKRTKLRYYINKVL